MANLPVPNRADIVALAYMTTDGTTFTIVDATHPLPVTGGGGGGGDVNLTEVGGTAVNGTVAGYGVVPVGGWSTKASVAVTTTAVTYTTGQVIGGLLTLTNVTPNADQRFLLQSVQIACKSTQTAAVDVYFFSANPSGSTITNGAALAIVVADFDKVAMVVHLTDWSAGNPTSFAKAGNIAEPMAPTSGTTSAYCCIVARGSIASGTTSEMTLFAKTASV